MFNKGHKFDVFLFNKNDTSAEIKLKWLLHNDTEKIMETETGNTYTKLESLFTIDLQTVSEWLICNKLYLHLGKTESFFIQIQT